MKVKLPKLAVTRFDGTHIIWFRFWNQFESEMDISELPVVSTFSYLKELIFPKVGTIIDGWAFTGQGYTRAKNILISKYGKSSEVTNAHIQNIMSLPHINSINFIRYMNSLRTWLGSVQALETMSKLKEITRNRSRSGKNG